MSSGSQPNAQDADELEAAVDQAIAACGGDMRSAIRALIVANEYLETEVGELMKAVSHAFVRGRFQTYSGFCDVDPCGAYPEEPKSVCTSPYPQGTAGINFGTVNIFPSSEIL